MHMVRHHYVPVQIVLAQDRSASHNNLHDACGHARVAQPFWPGRGPIEDLIQSNELLARTFSHRGPTHVRRQRTKQSPGDEERDTTWLPVRKISPVEDHKTPTPYCGLGPAFFHSGLLRSPVAQTPWLLGPRTARPFQLDLICAPTTMLPV